MTTKKQVNCAKLFLPIDIDIQFISGQGQFSGCPSSLRWTAPEVIQSPRSLETDPDSPHTIYSDVYSFGMCMWELAVCEDPFGDITEQEVCVWGEGGGHKTIGDVTKFIDRELKVT